MGSTAAQGWYLFLFLVGFTLGPAGLVALGWPVAIIGFVMIAASLVGFHAIKGPPTSDTEGTAHAGVPLGTARRTGQHQMLATSEAGRRI
jgi:hypothetical protein